MARLRRLRTKRRPGGQDGNAAEEERPTTDAVPNHALIVAGGGVGRVTPGATARAQLGLRSIEDRVVRDQHVDAGLRRDVLEAPRRLAVGVEPVTDRFVGSD